MPRAALLVNHLSLIVHEFIFRIIHYIVEFFIHFISHVMLKKYGIKKKKQKKRNDGLTKSLMFLDICKVLISYQQKPSSRRINSVGRVLAF